MAEIKQIKVDSTTYDITDANALRKVTYEWNKDIAFGSSGYLLIGKFPMYDSNITIDIDSTTSTTYHATLVIATQNINTSRGGTYVCNVYGDASNTATSSFVVQYSSGSNKFNVYFKPSAWSKNLIHIRAVALAAAPTESEICTSVTSVPTTDLITINNMLTANFLGISATASDATKLGGQSASYYASSGALGDYIPLAGTTSIYGDLIPSVTLSYNLGSNSNRFNYIYGSTINVNTLDGGASTLTLTGDTSIELCPGNDEVIIGGSLYPNGNGYTLGSIGGPFGSLYTSSIISPTNIYLSASDDYDVNIYANGGEVCLSGGVVTLSGSPIIFYGNAGPLSNAVFDLGSSNYRFKEVYAYVANANELCADEYTRIGPRDSSYYAFYADYENNPKSTYVFGDAVNITAQGGDLTLQGSKIYMGIYSQTYPALNIESGIICMGISYLGSWAFALHYSMYGFFPDNTVTYNTYLQYQVPVVNFAPIRAGYLHNVVIRQQSKCYLKFQFWDYCSSTINPWPTTAYKSISASLSTTLSKLAKYLYNNGFSAVDRALPCVGFYSGTGSKIAVGIYALSTGSGNIMIAYLDSFTSTTGVATTTFAFSSYANANIYVIDNYGNYSCSTRW